MLYNYNIEDIFLIFEEDLWAILDGHGWES